MADKITVYKADINFTIYRSRIKSRNEQITTCSTNKIENGNILRTIVDEAIKSYGNNIHSKNENDFTHYCFDDFDFSISGNWCHKKGSYIVMEDKFDEPLLIKAKVNKYKENVDKRIWNNKFNFIDKIIAKNKAERDNNGR